MKPPETVTLIDLEGKPIPLRENVPLHYFTGEYAHIVDFTWQFKDKDYHIYIGSSIKVGEATKHYDSLLPLILFINDQLTFIRNGMWETLAIYQATLGRYWEVPWYEPNELEALPQHDDEVEVILISGNIEWAWYDYEQGEGALLTLLTSKKTIDLKDIKAWRPNVEWFTGQSKRIFKNVTPWKGESTN